MFLLIPQTVSGPQIVSEISSNNQLEQWLARTTNAEITNKYLTIVCGIHEQIINYHLNKFLDIPF